MKTLTTKLPLLISLAAAMGFSSCSRNLASLSHTDKMTTAQALPANTAPVSPDKCTYTPPASQATAETPAAMSQAPENKPVARAEAPGLPAKHIRGNKAKQFVQYVKQETAKQLSVITGIGSNHNLASVKHAEKPDGLGGIAAICAIGAIVLAIFGLTNAAPVYWYLSVILIVAAVVFFLVYLAGKAAAPSHGGE